MKNSDLNIQLTFGDQSDQKTLLDTKLQFKFGKKILEEKQKQLKFSKDAEKGVGQNDMHFILKFHVSPGREKQAVEYLQRGMDQPDIQEKKYMNPLQRLLVRPKSFGRVSFEEEVGLVKVHYCIYEDYTFHRIPQKQAFFKFLNNMNTVDFNPILTFQALIKGQQGQSVKQRTQIQGNFIDIKMNIQDLPLTHLTTLFSEIIQQSKIKRKKMLEQSRQGNKNDPFYEQMRAAQQQRQQMDNFMMQIFFMIINGIKKIKLKYNLIAFRKIYKFYREVANLTIPHKPDSYTMKDLMKNKVEVEGIIPNICYIRGYSNFSHEGIFQRILKIVISVLKLNQYI